MKKKNATNPNTLHKLKEKRLKREHAAAAKTAKKLVAEVAKRKPTTKATKPAKNKSKSVEKFLDTFPKVLPNGMAVPVSPPTDTADPFAPLEAHELASRFPEMSHDEYEGLKAAILSHQGLIHPIMLFEGKILDGRHRNQACRELGIPPRFEEFSGDYQQAVDYVINSSAHRNTTAGQRVWCAVQFAGDLAEVRPLGRPSKTSANLATISGKSSEIAGLRFSVSPRSVEEGQRIQKADADIFADLGTGKLNVHQASNRLKLKNREKEVRKLTHIDVNLDDAEIREGDNLALIKDLDDDSVTCAFFDPPYNNGWKYDGDAYGDDLSEEEYLAGLVVLFDQTFRVLKPEGSLFLLCDHHYCDLIGCRLRSHGFHHQELIVWWETFGNHDANGLTCCARFIHYFTKMPSGFIFNTTVREESARQQIGDARANPDGKIPTTVWKVSRKQGTANDRVPFADAPPQLPVEIPERAILLASNPGDVILDAFNGNGTTAIAALKNGRQYIGFERSEKYARQSRQWIASQLAPEKERKAS